MRLKQVLPVVAVVSVSGAGIALANHPVIDPATVPEGYLAAHDHITSISTTTLRRALRSGKADLFVSHEQYSPGESTPFRQNPGPVFATVVNGQVTVEDASGDTCRRKTYVKDVGFARKPRQAYRLVAGPNGADVYFVQLAPRGTGNDKPETGPPGAC